MVVVVWQCGEVWCVVAFEPQQVGGGDWSRAALGCFGQTSCTPSLLHDQPTRHPMLLSSLPLPAPPALPALSSLSDAATPSLDRPPCSLSAHKISSRIPTGPGHLPLARPPATLHSSLPFLHTRTHALVIACTACSVSSSSSGQQHRIALLTGAQLFHFPISSQQERPLGKAYLDTHLDSHLHGDIRRTWRLHEIPILLAFYCFALRGQHLFDNNNIIHHTSTPRQHSNGANLSFGSGLLRDQHLLSSASHYRQHQYRDLISDWSARICCSGRPRPREGNIASESDLFVCLNCLNCNVCLPEGMATCMIDRQHGERDLDTIADPRYIDEHIAVPVFHLLFGSCCC